MSHPCAVLILDRKASANGPVAFRPCGAPSTSVISIRGDHLFAVCSRHNGRLERVGVQSERPA